MKTALVVVAPTGYQDKELDGTVKGLEKGGFDVVISSTEIGSCSGKLGGTTDATVALRDVIAADYDRIAFIGGPGAKALADNIDAHRVAREAVDMHMPLGAICVAPTILANAGILRTRKATVFADTEGVNIDVLRRHGATYTADPVTIDGLIVTANGPDAAKEFGEKLAMVG
jgi:protease I